MSNDKKVCCANPPKSTRWQKDQSENPKGRPKTKSEFMMDVAQMLTQPVDARAPDGTTVRLDGIEDAYLALCRRGLKGHKPSLLEAIRVMLEVGPAVQAKEEEQNNKRREIVERLEGMGVQIPEDAKLRK